MHSLLAKEKVAVGLLLFFFTIFVIPVAVASSDNGFASDGVIVQADITPVEAIVTMNCTWSPGQNLPGQFIWYDSNTIPTLPGSGWSNQTASLTLSMPTGVMIYVTDAWLKGDYFEVYKVDGVVPTTGEFIGMTPVVPIAGSTTTDPDVAFADPTYSHGRFYLFLPAGTHYFAFREVGHNYGSGGFFVKFCPGPVGGEVMVTPLASIISIAGLLGAISLAIVAVALSKRRK